MFFSLLFGGCQIVTSLLGNVNGKLAEADTALKAGDLATAAAKYDEAVKAAPTNVDAASGAAYLKMLAGDYAAADALLAAAEPAAGARAGEVKLRRAVVAVRSGDVDKAREPALGSGLAAGKLLAGEVDLANGERDAARALLTEVQAEPGAIGAVASEYLRLMGDANPLVAGLSEAQALWALGQRKVAVRSVEDLVKAYAESAADGDEQVLIWAGRAATVGEPDVAFSLLDAIAVSPPGQAWRVQATRGIALCASGQGDACVQVFEGLANSAPGDGYADARLSAALAAVESAPAAAQKLVEGMEGDNAARVLAALGDKSAAAGVAADPVFKSQLGG